MKWNSQGLLEMLGHMPARLTKQNLKQLQAAIDKDLSSLGIKNRADGCGVYAPFCNNCDRTGEFPCAEAYVQMKRAEGALLEIAATDDEKQETVTPVATLPVVEEAEEVIENNGETASQSEEVKEDAPTEQAEPAAESENTPEEQPEKETKKIRIAIARRKSKS